MTKKLDFSTIETTFKKVFKKLAELEAKVNKVASRSTGLNKFVSLLDVQFDPDSEINPPQEGSVPRWNAEAKKLTPGGGPVISKFFSYTETPTAYGPGGNAFAITIDLVADEDIFDPERPCLVTATVSISGACGPVAVEEDTVGGADLYWEAQESFIPDSEVSLTDVIVTFDGVTGTLSWGANPTLHFENNPVIEILDGEVTPGSGTSKILNATYLLRQFPGLLGSLKLKPRVTINLFDSSPGAVPPSPVPGYEISVSEFYLGEPNSPYAPVVWAFNAGRPSMTILLRDLDGAYIDEEYEVFVLSRVVQLP